MLSSESSRSLPPEQAAAVAELQRQWFGRPLKQLFGDVMDVCSLTQAQLAQRLGISAPMVSQLMSGRREKPGNPLVQERVVELSRALDEFESGTMGAGALIRLVSDMEPNESPQTRVMPQVRSSISAPDARAIAQVVRNMFAAVASSDDLLHAAGQLEKHHPDIALVVRVMGTGRTTEAEDLLHRLGIA